MGKKFLIDTNVLIDFQLERLPQNGKRFLVNIIDQAFTISFVTYIEFLGYPLATAAMENFIKLAGVIQIDKEVIEQTIALCRTKKIKLPDAIIAATVVVHGYTLISRNMDDFKSIKNLELLNPHEL
ncbi:type II toxin-antitoxin system VapC family toxin [Mucilaginibacter sp. ZB1P21]|uniref:Type II toxin-antitoxin system VapC family toxin n=1 Tax=Mucilaginibacter glaciei TaxID=2772109 RepID=A0A926S3S0_9SPHI|nr:type II toxin-antitoxin system VapC family toxin [Mucilaginibacter glaciei]